MISIYFESILYYDIISYISYHIYYDFDFDLSVYNITGDLAGGEGWQE